MAIHDWMFAQRSFRRLLGLGPDGETGDDDRAVQAIFDRIGANVMGKRMFEEGEAAWPEEAPFHTPVYVLTHQVRAPWERPGGTVFHFVDDGLQAALARARQAAGSKDVRISGGAEVIRAALHAGVVDELSIALAPLLLGRGLRFLDGVDPARVRLEVEQATHSPRVTHLRYRVLR